MRTFIFVLLIGLTGIQLGLQSYEFDYKLRANKDADFTCDDMILNDDRISAKLYDGSAEDKL